MSERLTVSVEEAADLCGISKRLVETLIARHEFPVWRAGDRVRIPLRALDEFLVSQALESINENGQPRRPRLAVEEARDGPRRHPAGI